MLQCGATDRWKDSILRKGEPIVENERALRQQMSQHWNRADSLHRELYGVPMPVDFFEIGGNDGTVYFATTNGALERIKRKVETTTKLITMIPLSLMAIAGVGLIIFAQHPKYLGLGFGLVIFVGIMLLVPTMRAILFGMTAELLRERSIRSIEQTADRAIEALRSERDKREEMFAERERYALLYADLVKIQLEELQRLLGGSKNNPAG